MSSNKLSDLGDPRWQGIGVLVTIVALIIATAFSCWGIYLVYNPPQHNEAAQNVTATVTPMQTTQATATTQPTVTITVNPQTIKQTPEQATTSEKTYTCIVPASDGASNVYSCTKSEYDMERTNGFWFLVVGLAIFFAIGCISAINKWKNRY